MMSTGLEMTRKIPLNPLSMTELTMLLMIFMLGASISRREEESLGIGADAVMMTMSASLQSLYSPA